MVHGRQARHPRTVAVTQVADPASKDLERRQRNYLISMAIRVLCFVGLVLTPSPWRWLFLIGAAVIPSVAVLLANVAERRDLPEAPPEDVASPVPMIGTGQVIEGQLVDDDAEPGPGSGRSADGQ